MAIAALQNIPGTPEELAIWAFAHQAHHLDIINHIYDLLQIAMPQYVLDPFDPNNPSQMGVWAYQHQIMHDNQNFILGIEGSSLVEVDWQDQENLGSWIQTNFAEHLQAANTLGVA